MADLLQTRHTQHLQAQARYTQHFPGQAKSDAVSLDNRASNPADQTPGPKDESPQSHYTQHLRAQAKTAAVSLEASDSANQPPHPENNAPRETIEISQRDPRYPGLLLQPDSRPISQEQLAAEVKSIYAGLTMVETKCIRVDIKRTAAVPDASLHSKLTNDHWQALIALHRTLFHEHHDFFLASQHPSASPALRRLASKYSMPARMWKHGIHSFLELLRHRTPESLGSMLAFIYLSYQMMMLLYETMPAFQDTSIECLDDLVRYRMAIEDEDLCDRETWAEVARFWHSKLPDKDKLPRVGRLYHHLAILARPNTLQQLYYSSQSLTYIDPVLNARESILTLFDRALSWDNRGYQCNHSLPAKDSSIRAHGPLFRKIHFHGPEDVLGLFFSRQRVYIDQVNRAIAKWKERSDYTVITRLGGLVDEEERTLELASTSKSRTEHMLRLDLSLSTILADKIVYFSGRFKPADVLIRDWLRNRLFDAWCQLAGLLPNVEIEALETSTSMRATKSAQKVTRQILRRFSQISRGKLTSLVPLALLIKLPTVSASNSRDETTYGNTSGAAYGGSSVIDYMFTALVLFYMIDVLYFGSRARPFSLALMMAASIFWIPIVTSHDGSFNIRDRWTILKVWAATTLSYVGLSYVEAVHSGIYLLEVLVLAGLFLTVGMVMQQFASGSLMNALPPSLALAAFIATLLPQHFSPAPPGNIEGGQVNREQPIAIQDVERMLESPINVESHDPVSSGSRSQILVPHQSGRTRRQTA